MICNLCGSTEFTRQGSRENVRCVSCHSIERTRLLRLMLEHMGLPRPGSRILHLAPEYGLHGWLGEVAGDGYDPVDFNPRRYKWADARRLDLTADAESLESGSYDLILHSHVMEHVPCNITAVLWHLHRALDDDGMHVCCIPFIPGEHYEESLEHISPEEATSRFGQHDHVRRFGALDMQRTIGMIFDLEDEYDVRKFVDESLLLKHNIPTYTWTGYHQHTVLALPKNSIKLQT